ncbi:MAG: amino acid ABC transporter substrate-binding protein [Burkholderiales bacterium]|nr:amino acid ABC transporter substrate-binding protein [Burkholderiales bacterium]
MARIKARGELVVAVPNFDSPPFFYGQGKDLTGIDINLAEGIAQELGVKLRFNRDAKSFNGVVDRVANGEADLAICKLSRTLERAQAIRYSEPYLKLRHALALNRIAFARLAHGQELPDVIRHFNGTLAVIAKSSFADFAKRNFPLATIKEYPTWDAAVAAVKTGEVVATYRDEFEIKRLLKEDNQASLTLRTVTLDDLTDTIGIATNASDPQLLSFVNLYLSQRQERLDVGKVLQALAAIHHP